MYEGKKHPRGNNPNYQEIFYTDKYGPLRSDSVRVFDYQNLAR